MLHGVAAKTAATHTIWRKQQGYEVISLLTMMMSKEKSNFHMIPSGILDAQSDALGISLVKQQATPETYENDFKSALRSLKLKGAEGLVTGDIYEVAGHEEGWLGQSTQRSWFKTSKTSMDGRYKTNLS